MNKSIKIIFFQFTMPSNKYKGDKAEKLATNYFLKLGYSVLKKNYRYKRSEIDLIVCKENLIIFIEVKYRSSIGFGQPEEFVSENQKIKILEAADEFIHLNNWKGNIRFDIIAINAQNELEHFKDAFY